MASPFQKNPITTLPALKKRKPVQRYSLSAIHKAVSNCLFNDLGLNRKEIQNMLKAEITNQANTTITKENVDSWITNAISKAVYGRYAGNRIQTMIDDEVKKAVNKHVKDKVDQYLHGNLVIDIKKRK